MAGTTSENVSENATAAVPEVDPKHRNSSAYDVTDLRGISSFDDAIALATSVYGDVVEAEKEMGTGFRVLNGNDKDRLIGTAFIILSMDFNHGDQGDFVSFLCVTENNAKFVVNDGSTGIFKQLEEYALRGGKPGGLLVNGGLRKSEYEKEIDGQVTKAVTYYLNI